MSVDFFAEDCSLIAVPATENVHRGSDELDLPTSALSMAGRSRALPRPILSSLGSPSVSDGANGSNAVTGLYTHWRKSSTWPATSPLRPSLFLELVPFPDRFMVFERTRGPQ